MTQNFSPITPPPKLFTEWLAEAKRLHPNESLGFVSGQIAQLAYRAGADMELEACRLWVSENCDIYSAVELIQFRRPKPPSLKERIATAIAHGDNSIALALLDQALPD